MAQTKLQGNPVQTSGDLPAVGQAVPEFSLVDAKLQPVNLSDYAGRRVVLNIFPSIDTDVCAQSVRKFNELAASMENTTVICISHDLPFALGRFCGAEGIDNVVVASGFRSSFAVDYGVMMVDGALQGLCARTVIVLDPTHQVLATQLVPEIGQEPDYETALAVL